MLWLMARAGYKPVIEYCGGTEIGGGYITGTVVQSQAPATFSTPALGCDFVIIDGANRANLSVRYKYNVWVDVVSAAMSLLERRYLAGKLNAESHACNVTLWAIYLHVSSKLAQA